LEPFTNRDYINAITRGVDVKRVKSIITLLLILSFVVVSFPKIGIVKAEDTIYIRADGTVEGTDKIHRNGNVYTFTGNIYDPIVVEKDNIVVDGDGYVLQETDYNRTQVYPLLRGIMLNSRSNVTIKNIKIKSFYGGLYLNSSSGINISGNTIIAEIGIGLTSSHNNTISRNIITKARIGIFLSKSTHNIISGNYIINNGEGIFLQDSSNQIIIRNYIANNVNGTYIFSPPFRVPGSSNNLFYHNSFVNNTRQIYMEKGFAISDPVNSWDNGSEGNYWGNYYYVVDDDGDGIGDSPIVFDANNTDNYPLVSSIMPPLFVFDAGTWEDTQYNVYVFSNSTASDFSFNPETTSSIQFSVEVENGTTGFCNVTIPKGLLYTEDNWTVLVDGASVTPTVNEDASNTYLYFTYNHGTKTVEIIGTDAIPEFPSWIILSLFIVATMVVTMFKNKLSRKGLKKD